MTGNEIRISGTEFQSLLLNNCSRANIANFTGQDLGDNSYVQIIDDVEIKPNMLFNNCIILDRFTFNGRVDFINGSFKEEFEIHDCKFLEDVKIRSSIFSKGVKINGGHFKKGLIISGGAVECDITISNVSINNLTLTSLWKRGRLTLIDPQIQHLIFNLLVNEVKFRLINVNMNDHNCSISIQNSSMGETDLIGCDWENAKFIVDNSRIIDMFYTDTIFPINILSSSDSVLQNSHVLDTYNQLKAISARQNDKKYLLEFTSKSNDYIFKSAKQKIGISFVGMVFISEFIQLGLGKISNNYGTSYSRALLCMIIIMPIIYAFYLICTFQEISFSINPVNWIQSVSYCKENDFIAKFWEFVNPLRSKSIFGANVEHEYGIALFVDWFSRIVFLYLVVQFVQAFRKYGKL